MSATATDDLRLMKSRREGRENYNGRTYAFVRLIGCFRPGKKGRIKQKQVLGGLVILSFLLGDQNIWFFYVRFFFCLGNSLWMGTKMKTASPREGGGGGRVLVAPFVFHRNGGVHCLASLISALSLLGPTGIGDGWKRKVCYLAE